MDFLGKGLTIPFQRDRKNDFASSSGVTLVKSRVQQILGTIGGSQFTQGELPWDTQRGSLLLLLKHQNNNFTLQELAKVYVGDALRKYEPAVQLLNLNASRVEDGEANKLAIRIKYNVIQRNVPGNQVVLENVEQTVLVGIGG